MAEQKQTPNHDKTAPPSPQKKKRSSAYDQPFGNEKSASYVNRAEQPNAADAEQTSAREEPASSEPTAHTGSSSATPASKATDAPTATTARNAGTTSEKKRNGSATSETAKQSAGSDERIHASTAAPRKNASNANAKNKGKEQIELELPRSARPAHKVIPFVLFAVAIFIGASLLLNLFCNTDNRLASDPSAHWMGVVGYYICYTLFGTFGPAVFTLPLLLFNMAIFWKRYIDNKLVISKTIASLLFLVTLSSVIHVFCLIPLNGHEFTVQELMEHGSKMTGGGIVGGSIGYLLFRLCHYTGAFIIGFLVLGASLFYFLGMTPQHLWNHLRNRRQLRAKRNPSYSEQSAQEAENRAKMEEKIRRTTAKQVTVEEVEDDFEAEAPLGAVRVVQPAPAKKSTDKIAPIPQPHLDPNDGEEVFVPSVVNERMANAEREQTAAEYEAFQAELRAKRQAELAAKANAHKEETPINPAENRDAAVEPIFPRTGENRQMRRIPRTDRNFDLKSVFIDLEDTDTPIAQHHHAPVPPEVPPATGTQPSVAAERNNGTPVTGSASARVTPGTVRTPTPQTAQKPKTAGKPLPQDAEKPTFRQAKPQAHDFGLSNEEFEKLEAQQITLPRTKPSKPAEAEKKATAAPATVGKVAAVTAKGSAKTTSKKYVFPPISYLHPGEPMTEENLAELQANMEALAATLKSFHVGIEDNIRYSCGPTVTRYEITPAAGVRVRTITNLSDDIALALRASGGIRIEAPIPGTNSVGIEVPNKTRSTIYLRELIESKAFTESKNKLTACLGAGIAGEPLIFDIAKMPHLLIAGTTGSGKSVCINCIVMSLLYKATPDEVKLVMIDPKKVEFSIYKNIPHLMAPVVTTPKDAAGALQASVEEMERRFELFETVGVRDLKGYNAATADDPDMPTLPHIVIIIDELADLMMTARDEVETAICRIAQKARAAGMHLIIGTQRPSADVVTGLIKSNVPSRIAFAVKSQVDSRVILDHIGAEALTGRGDMLFVPIGAMRDTRVQGAFVDDKEVEKICEFIRVTNGNAEYDEKFISKLKELAAQCGNKGRSGGEFAPSSGGEDGGDKSDNKYADAVRIAIEEKRISTSLLQRKLEIGYSRAAKLIDRMQAEGLVSAPDGSKPRTILITPEEYMAKFVDTPDSGDAH